MDIIHLVATDLCACVTVRWRGVESEEVVVAIIWYSIYSYDKALSGDDGDDDMMRWFCMADHTACCWICIICIQPLGC